MRGRSQWDTQAVAAAPAWLPASLGGRYEAG